LLSNIESSIRQCEECIGELEDEANKFKAKSAEGFQAIAKATARRVAYPFRQSTLQKLDEDIDEIVSHLSLALQLLQQKDIGHIQDVIEDVKALLSLVRTSQISSTIREWLKAPMLLSISMRHAKRCTQERAIGLSKDLPSQTGLRCPDRSCGLTALPGVANPSYTPP
jgi:hypothetical protein